MIELLIQDDFNLDKIINSGQCFRARKLDSNLYQFLSGEKLLLIKKRNPNHYRFYCSKEEFDNLWFGKH